MYSLPQGTIVVKDGIHKKVPGACVPLEPHLSILSFLSHLSAVPSPMCTDSEKHTHPYICIMCETGKVSVR